MSTVIYRSYLPGDEAGLVALWNRCLLRDPITPGRFRNLVLLDPNFDPKGMRIAEIGGRPIGCFYAVRRLLPMLGVELETELGWMPFFFVAPEYRRQGVATRLLEEARAFLADEGRKKMFFSAYAPNYIVPGIDRQAYAAGASFLERAGFVRRYTAVAMDYSLVDHEVPEDVQELRRLRESEGYTFSLAGERDLYELIQFATHAFNPDWGRAIREGLLQGLQLSQILVARQNGQLIGFCLHGGYEGVRERFGPFGVDPGQRGKGIGKILLHECLRLMRAQGLHGAWFLWTGEQTPAGQLYKRLGFTITRSFDVVCKDF
jgi:mycothiol synthase